LDQRLGAEEGNRSSADSSLQTRLGIEEAARASADTSVINAANSSLVVIENSLNSRVLAEEGIRSAADISIISDLYNSQEIISSGAFGASDTVAAGKAVVFVDANAGDILVKLPDAINYDVGRVIKIKRVDGSANLASIETQTGQKIDSVIADSPASALQMFAHAALAVVCSDLGGIKQWFLV